MTKCVLFHTEGCHLCEEALAMLIQQLPEAEIELIDITEDAAHVEKYQFSIPVVKEAAMMLSWDGRFQPNNYKNF